MASGSGGGGYREGRMVGDYMFGRQIGSGSFSVVWLARHRVHGVEVAVKEIVMDKLSKKLQESLLSEIVILKHIKHPNIIRMHEIIEGTERIYLILEYCRGGDLSVYLQRHGKILEATAKQFMQQLANGLQVLRDNNLMHRDLKPQNLLLTTTDDNVVLKIADFGFARSLQPLVLAETLCGSPLYMAPEIMNLQKYDAKADLWSVGAILFQLVTGKTPFTGNNQIQLLQNINSTDLRFPQDCNLSHDCIDLCKKLLRRNPLERLTFEEFFNHPFLAQSKPDQPLRRISSPQGAHKMTLNYQEECMPFPLEDESGGVDQSLSAQMNNSIRSTYGFHVRANKDSSSIKTTNFGSLFKPIPMNNSGYEHDSYRMSGHMKHTIASSKDDKNDQTSVDSLDLVEQEYVMVSGPPLEMSSSSLSNAEMRNSSPKSENSPAETRKNGGVSAPVPIVSTTITKAGTFGSLDSHNSPVSGASEGFMDDAIELPSANFITRIRSLQQYGSVISELVKEESENGRRLEAFSVQLILLAIWKQAVNICHSQADFSIEGSPSQEIKSRVNSNASPISRSFYRGSESLDAIYPQIEREFLHSVEHAEELEKGMGQVDEATEMPDAIEIIYQSALALGRLGAVDEMMKNADHAEACYAKAGCLLNFLLVEASSVPLNPPLCLTNSDRFRLRSYIDIINNRRCQSRSQRVTLLNQR
ncbi:CBL-interacting protein kinase 11 [Platanthera zijinensis]|uniref:CBL-interacting protein kinase 11 n=1 Tax=Platanthera zijinensis TaxID=2320716 RepID=A0AAP0B3X3_9ASPA